LKRAPKSSFFFNIIRDEIVKRKWEKVEIY
jgi:hypothetical protein